MNARSMRLSTRLLFAFGLVVLMGLMSSGVSLWQLSLVQGNLKTVVTDNNVRAALNQRMERSIQSVSSLMRTIMLIPNEEGRKAEYPKIVQERESYDLARTELDKYPASEKGRALRTEIDAAKTKSRGLNDQVIGLTHSGQAKEALDLLMQEALPATQAWLGAVVRNIDLQEKANDQRYGEAEGEYSAAKNMVLGCATLTAVFALGLGLWVVRSVRRDIGGEPSEVAELARAVSNSDLSSAVRVKPGDESSVVAAMARMQSSLSSIVQRVRESAESVATASSQISMGNSDLSGRTEQQASALQQTAASMEQIGATVKQNAENAMQANQFAQGATSNATKGAAVVVKVVETMKDIDGSSKRIGEIIGVIDGIAFQTNILALNAAVEAARAGEQGRGFAVVASEVRALAQRSAVAAKDIKALISESLAKVDQGSRLVDEAGGTMSEIVKSITRVSDIVAEISAACSEQATGISQVSEAITQMDQVTQQNAALVEESAAAAESLNGQAKDLVGAMAVFVIESK